MGKATVKEIAAQAKVSIATVSRVVDGKHYVSPDLKQRVLDAIDKLGYYPNASAQNLKRNSSHLIGLIINDIGNYFYPVVANYVERVINPKGYELVIFNTSFDRERELAYLKLLLSFNVDGIIINSTGLNDAFIAQISKSTPVVSIFVRNTDLNYQGDFVSNDDYQDVYNLTNYLILSRHRKIAVINGPASLRISSDRYAGFKGAMNDSSLVIRDEYISFGEYTNENGYLAASQLLHLDDPPTAVMALSNQGALGILRYVVEHDVAVPDDVSLAYYGFLSNYELLAVQPTFMSVYPQILGIKCGEQIISRIKDNSQPGRDYIFNSTLNKRSGVKRL
jgi:DNA-binding LacI/PurR family transcriptional regulator